ncbi:MAG: hypothetical protein DDT26_00493 [Dehalococcoidia bacterium]|nr:hypothetical protein [Chloroflexota bacterium]
MIQSADYLYKLTHLGYTRSCREGSYGMLRTIAEINEKIRRGQTVVVTKEWIGRFLLTEPVAALPGVEAGIEFKPLRERPIE